MGLSHIILAGTEVITFERTHRLHHVFVNADVVNHITKVFARVVTIDTADGLYQGVLLQRLVVVEIGQTRHIKARNPHIHYDNDAEVALWHFEGIVHRCETLLIA